MKNNFTAGLGDIQYLKCLKQALNSIFYPVNKTSLCHKYRMRHASIVMQYDKLCSLPIK
jgi:hypothetical protein